MDPIFIDISYSCFAKFPLKLDGTVKPFLIIPYFLTVEICGLRAENFVWFIFCPYILSTRNIYVHCTGLLHKEWDCRVGIYLVCFLCKIIKFEIKSLFSRWNNLNDFNKDLILNFRSSLKSHPLWVTLNATFTNKNVCFLNK